MSQTQTGEIDDTGETDETGETGETGAWYSSLCCGRRQGDDLVDKHRQRIDSRQKADRRHRSTATAEINVTVPGSDCSVH